MSLPDCGNSEAAGSIPGGSTEEERECLYLTVAMVKLSGSIPGGVQKRKGSVST